MQIRPDIIITVVQAHAKGAIIQLKQRNSHYAWTIDTDPVWDWNTYEYRVQPTQETMEENIQGLIDNQGDMHETLTAAVRNIASTDRIVTEMSRAHYKQLDGMQLQIQPLKFSIEEMEKKMDDKIDVLSLILKKAMEDINKRMLIKTP